MAIRFTWDPVKARTNVAKHGVGFQEAASAFRDPLALYTEDAAGPARAVLVGMSERQRLILVVHAEIDDSAIRIISARRATSHERRKYEEGP